MSNAIIFFVIASGLPVLMVVGNIVFSRVAERKNPPIGGFLNCDGVRLHYIDRGDPSAPCLVMFHGNGSMLQDLTISGLVDLLARDNRVICFDRPGFGHSLRPRSRTWTATAQAALFVKALDQLNAGRPLIIGHSWGTLVALALSFRNDFPLRGLVLASGYYFPTVRWDVWIMSGPAVPILGDLFRYTIGPIISWAILPGAFRKLFAPRSIPPTFKNEFPASLTVRPKQLRAAAEESALLIPTVAEFRSSYGTIRCPVSICHGIGDEIIEVQQARELYSTLTGSTDLCLIQNAGHMVTHTDPAAIVQAVRSVRSRSIAAVAS